MRTLTRPMFNMGGPIKQGVMHGIREPHKHGGRAALVGNPVYPKTDGREHHAVVSGTIAAGVGLNALRHAAMRYGSRYLPRMWQGAKRMFGTTTPASVTRGTHFVPGASGSYSPVIMNPSKFNPNWLGRDPLVQSVGWAGKTLTSGPAKSIAGKAFQFATAPSTVIGGVVWYLWPDGSQRKTPPPTGIMKPGGYPEGTVPGEGEGKITVKSEAERKAFANKQREERVQRYLKMMGYDRAKKTAIADALIDASKIVGDRGTLDPKNITQELINPIIQATSKRLDKPDQIREAVGLMATKAEIEKDMSAETDALAKKLTTRRIDALDRQLEEGVGIDLLTYIGSQKGKVKSDQLERVARLSANKHGHKFKKVTDADMAAVGEGASEEEIIQSVVGDDGVYMIGDAIIQVSGGKPNRIV